MSQLNKIWNQRFKKGAEMELFVGAFLLSHGLMVHIPVKKNRPDYKKRANYGDSHDIKVINNRNLVYLLEVKSMAHEWTCIDDFPFDEILVDNKAQWDKKKQETILAHIFISQETGAMFTLGISSRKFWHVKDVYDYSVGGGHRLKVEKYVCHKSYAKPIEKLIQYIIHH